MKDFHFHPLKAFRWGIHYRLLPHRAISFWNICTQQNLPCDYTTDILDGIHSFSLPHAHQRSALRQSKLEQKLYDILNSYHQKQWLSKECDKTIRANNEARKIFYNFKSKSGDIVSLFGPPDSTNSLRAFDHRHYRALRRAVSVNILFYRAQGTKFHGAIVGSVD